MNIEKVLSRDNGRCILCGYGGMLEPVPHHCFFRSEYSYSDSDNEWNLITICKNCHNEIHFGISAKRKEKEKRAKQIAILRYTGKNKEILKRIMESKEFDF
jgi:5-methylcytosine-specific restriction endonuclease McrA